MGVGHLDAGGFGFVFHVSAILHGLAVEHAAAFGTAKADGGPLGLVVARLQDGVSAVFAGFGDGGGVFGGHGGYIGRIH